MGKGIFITFEGADGVGKSTQLVRTHEYLEQAGFTVLVLREPGGTAIGEKIRAILLDAAHSEMADLTELLLYEAARAQITEEVIRPALERGSVVLCDRFFDSTVAYQSFGRGIDRATVDSLNMTATQGLSPDITFLLDMPVDSSLKRATAEAADRLESEGEDLQQRVRDGFRQLAQEEERIVSIDATGTPDEVFARIEPHLKALTEGEAS